MIMDKNVQEQHIYITVEPTKPYKFKKWNKKSMNLEFVIMMNMFTFLEEKIRKIYYQKVKDIIWKKKNGKNYQIFQEKEQKEKLYVYKIQFYFLEDRTLCNL